MEWTYLGCKLSNEPTPEEVFGFTYLITFTDGSLYVGRKQIWMKRKLKPRVGDRKNAVRKKLYEDKWREYEGSSKHRGDREVAAKEILSFCFSKKELTYEENRELYTRNVLRDELYLNDNISGKFYSKDLI